jgi:solute carrier family 6 GABA transporter-like protein 1
MSDDWEDISGSEATEYFFHQVIGTYTLDEGMIPTRLIPANVLYLALSWLIVGLCLSFGLKVTGRIAYITMGLPIIMLAILLIRALTLPGASKGINLYLGQWDLSVLVDQPDIWSTAVSQIFFSVGVAVSPLRLTLSIRCNNPRTQRCLLFPAYSSSV